MSNSTELDNKANAINVTPRFATLKMEGTKMDVITELARILSRFTPEQLDLFRFAAQDLIARMQSPDSCDKSK